MGLISKNSEFNSDLSPEDFRKQFSFSLNSKPRNLESYNTLLNMLNTKIKKELNYNDFKKRIWSGTRVNVKELDLKSLKIVEKIIRMELMLNLDEAKSKIITGAINILSGASIISGAIVIAAAGVGTGGVIITGDGIHALYNGYKLMRIDNHIYEAQKIKEELDRENVHTHNLTIAEKFVEMEVKFLKNKKREILVNLVGDVKLVVGGCLLVAAAVSGVGSQVIGTAVPLVVGVAALHGFERHELRKKDGAKKLQKSLKSEDSKKEQKGKALRKDFPATLSNHIIVQYMKMEPETLIKMMDRKLDVSPGEGRVEQMLQLDTPKFGITATLMLPRSL